MEETNRNDAWVEPQLWDACLDPGVDLSSVPIVFGFDGPTMVACSIKDGLIYTRRLVYLEAPNS